MLNEIVFAVTCNVSVCIPVSIPKEELHMLSAAKIFLCSGDSAPLLLHGQRSLVCSLGMLQDLIIALLRKRIELPESYFNKGLGYWENEALNNKLCCGKHFEGSVHVCQKDGWVGMRSSLWGSSVVHNTTYIYTYKDKIYLEIAPIYPWTIDEPEPGDNYISYEEFMRTYQPIARFELSQKTIKEWLLQATDVINIMKRDAGWEEDILPPDIVHLLDEIGPVARSVISLRPLDGKNALFNSVSCGDNTPARVGISKGQIVALKITHLGTQSATYHGYVVPWDQLRSEQQRELIKHGLTSHKGIPYDQ